MAIKKCKNRCIFCFIDQLPKGLRKSLYLKDDDYVESFKHGNFITLTNVSEEEIRKIIKYNLSPLYISFHSADSKIRDIIFNNKDNCKAIDFLKILDTGNIITNIQIVVCPGINDKSNLINTLKFLKNFKNIHSICLVPVGITKYNKNYKLVSFNKEMAVELIVLVNNYIKHEKVSNIYLSDEFFIISGKDFPPYNNYKDFPQLENGIGLIVDFKKSFFSYINKIYKKSEFLGNKLNSIKDNEERSLLIITSEYSEFFLNTLINELYSLLKELNINFNYKVNVLKVKNYFFGGNVKVKGLLSFKDIEKELNNKENLNFYDKILISDIIFNRNGLTLDNKSKNDFFKISKQIKFIKNKGYALARELIK